MRSLFTQILLVYIRVKYKSTETGWVRVKPQTVTRIYYYIRISGYILLYIYISCLLYITVKVSCKFSASGFAVIIMAVVIVTIAFGKTLEKRKQAASENF